MAAPTILSVPTILDAAKLAGGYSCIDRGIKNNLFGGFIEPFLPEKINFVEDRVQNRYDKNPTDTTLRDAANLLWSLIGKYGIRAVNNLQEGGIVVTPTTNIGSYLIVPKSYPQFVVGDTDAPMNEGDTVLVITDSLIVPESNLGQVVIHMDGGELGRQLLDRQNYNVVYAAGQFTITFFQGVIATNLIEIDYPIKQTLVYAGGTPTPAEVVYTATTVNVQTKTLVDGNSEIFLIELGTQGKLLIELVGQDSSNETFAGEWTAYVSNITGTVTLSNLNGGIYQPYSGGDINSNIVIDANVGLGGIEIIITGFSGKTITANAKFDYSSFNF